MKPRTAALAVVVIALVVVSGHPVPSSDASQSARNSGHFASELLVGNIPAPTDFAFAPDGRIFVATLAGDVLIVKNGMLLPQPFISISVNNWYERGLIGLALDPNFDTTPNVYLYYTYESNPDDLEGLKTGRLIRVTADGDIALPKSEIVLLGSEVGSSARPACGHLPSGSDCIPADGPSHLGGALGFAPDGNLFLATGDAAFGTVNPEELMPRAQDLASLAGKLLRLDVDGNGLEDNPFYTGDPTANRSKVWAYGLRQPFRMAIQPETGLPFIGDVGSEYWDEIDVGASGRNFGWPCFEGEFPHPENRELVFCHDFYSNANAPAQPMYSYSVPPAAAVIAGVFYEGGNYPEDLIGSLFFGDWARRSISVLKVDAEGELVANSVKGLISEAGAPVDLELGPEGDVYYLSFQGAGFRESETGEIRRIRFVAKESGVWSGRARVVAVGGMGAMTMFAVGGAFWWVRHRRPASS
ncbi:MAG: PQQ-dependent sugar dehydrogenase [Chloroflexi bacterium]|nr:PQQ-dependent sugar dehydrogenase [Chloroflexota bacterium]